MLDKNGNLIPNQNLPGPACNEKFVEITSADLPLSCPPRTERVWDAHPRVYIPIETVGKMDCPYCGTKYLLKDFVNSEK